MIDYQLNPLEIECTMFFQENPYTFETLHGLTTRLGRNIEDLLPVLEQLVANSILEKVGNGDQAIYRYIQPLMTDINGAIAWRGV
ncbi:hypothetical protein ACFSCX_15245 [Bacillus salitolerans]|uniref:Uncharacterized protein n=1 Tax=Bacillus salitolerans TaxID=1437434 RepID=A0ABW4LTW4_9BACI